jgi:hypothetical protein
MSLFIKLLFTATGPGTLRQFSAQCRAPMETQNSLLQHILRKNAETAFGRRHHFGRLTTFAEYQKNVPVSTYDDLEPYIQKALRGVTAQLTAETPVLFATTSGTTGASKYIPVTPESRSAKSQLMRVWLSSLYQDHPGIFSGRILTVVSPEVESCAPCGTPCGAESGHAYRNMPRALLALYSAPYEVFEIKDYDAKYYTLLRLAAGQPITLLVTVNPSTVLLLGERLARHTESILRDVRDGGVAKDIPIADELRAMLAAQLPPNPGRAKQLERAAANNNGVLDPKGIWPDLAAIACWKGGTVGMYLEKFGLYFPPDIPVRDLGYLASEHRGSIPLSDAGDAGVTAVTTNVYEFFPADEERKPGPCDLLTLDQLEAGRRYFVYVTTLGGLYRYDMNDIIEVVGTYEQTPLIRFVQKGKGVVSFTGEKLYESQVLAAVREALQPLGESYEFIAAVGEMAGQQSAQPRYVFLVEFDRPPTDADGRVLASRLESALGVHNAEYRSKRDSFRLDAPVIRAVRAGEFDAYRRRMVENGKLDGQFKILRLTTDAAFAGEFASERDYVAEATSKG